MPQADSKDRVFALNYELHTIITYNVSLRAEAQSAPRLISLTLPGLSLADNRTVFTLTTLWQTPSHLSYYNYQRVTQNHVIQIKDKIQK